MGSCRRLSGGRPYRLRRGRIIIFPQDHSLRIFEITETSRKRGKRVCERAGDVVPYGMVVGSSNRRVP